LALGVTCIRVPWPHLGNFIAFGEPVFCGFFCLGVGEAGVGGVSPWEPKPYRLFDPQDDYQRTNERSTRVISDVPNSFTDYRVRSPPPPGKKRKEKEKKKNSTKGKFKSPLWERSEVLEDRQTVSQTEGSWRFGNASMFAQKARERVSFGLGNTFP